MVTTRKQSEMQNKTLKNNQPSKGSEKEPSDFAECLTQNLRTNPNETEKRVSTNIYEIDKKMIDSENDLPAEFSMHAIKKHKGSQIYDNINIESLKSSQTNEGVLIPLGNGIFKLVEKTRKKENKKISNLNFAISIKNIEEPDKYRNPILLEKYVKKLFPRANNAYVLKFGDIRIWFNNETDTIEALKVKTEETFGEYSCVKRAN